MACLIVSHTSIHNFFYLGDVQGPKSRLKVGEKTEKEKVDTPSDLKAAVVKDKEKEKIAAIPVPVPVPQKESKSGAAAVAVAALLNSNKANSTTSDSVSSSSKLDVGTKGGISVVPVLEIAASQSDKSTSAISGSIVESMVGSSTADNSQALKVVAPTPAVTVTASLPVKAAQEMVQPSAPSSSASATTSMVEALFLSSPLLTTANRTTIQNFFSDDWRSHFPPAFTAENPVLKIKLSTEEKVCIDALPIHFFILLSLFISLSLAFFLSISFSPSLILSQSS